MTAMTVHAVIYHSGWRSLCDFYTLCQNLNYSATKPHQICVGLSAQMEPLVCADQTIYSAEQAGNRTSRMYCRGLGGSQCKREKKTCPESRGANFCEVKCGICRCKMDFGFSTHTEAERMWLNLYVMRDFCHLL
ncbi:uncharacterized protein LOC126210540 [Schistocerca nitens]|uniref:uncharacterized protein LOC126210540 n=1 Tax=Schistocerca nitens TaxID=7011 RepID=UPI002118E8C4|nr:uncharacterized protein LOC126210540 [Schistocerca nitens]